MEKTLLELAGEVGNDASPVEQQPTSPTEEDEGGVLDTVGRSLSGALDLWKSAGAGIAKAGFETKDFLVGEPEEGEKSDLRRGIEQRSEELRSESPLNGVVETASQFVTGMLGAGKLMAPVKAAQKLKTAGKAGRLAYETAQGAMAGAVVFDPHEERLSNLIQEFDALENPVTEFLAADPNDSAAMGRFKNALEGIGMDLAVAGTFALAVKALRLAKGGDEAAAKAVLDEVVTQGEVVKVPEVSQKVTPKKNTQKALIGDQIKSPAEAIPAKHNPKVFGYDPYDATLIQSELDVADDVIRTFEEDLATIQQFGSREEAIANGAKLGRSNIPWQKISGSDDLQTLVDATAGRLKARMDEAKGGDVLTDLRVQELVKETAEMFGDDPSGLMGELVSAGEGAREMVSKMEASYIIARRLFEDAHDAVAKARMGLFDTLGGTPEAAKAEVMKRFMAASDMLAAGNSIRSNAGRTLRRMRREFAITDADVNAMRQLDPDKLMEVIYASKGDIKKLRQVANPGWARRVLDEATFALTNNLLWFYPTHLVNTTTNLYMLGARPLEKWIGSLAMGKGGSAIRKQAQLEMAYTATSLGDAWTAMVEAFRRGDSVLAPHQTEMFEQGSRVNAKAITWKPVNDVWDLFENGYKAARYHNIIGLPTRSLGAVDEFIKTLRYRAVVQAKAAMEAAEAGITGPNIRHHIQSRMDEAFTPEGRALDATALHEAQITTFQQELLSGTLGAGIRNLRHNYPSTALILPFVKTPVNVLRYAHKMTPGLNILQTEYRQMLSGALGREAQAQAAGQMAMGSLFMGLAAHLALSGKITGGGPSDYAMKKQLLGHGWQPYSFVIDNPDGSKQYIPIGRFDPVGMPFGMVADLVDMQVTHPGTKDAQKGMVAVGVAIAKAFSEKTFMMNVNQLIQALSDPEKNLGKFMGNLAGNVLIPASSGVRNYGNSDPYVREARSFLDHMMKGLPGYSEGLPPQRDAFGEPMWRKRGLTTNEDHDLVEAEHARIIVDTGLGIRSPAPTRGGVDLRDVELSDGRNAYDRLQELVANPGKGKPLKSALSKLITSQGYNSLVDGPADVAGTKLGAISSVVSKYRSAAWQRMLKDYPELRTMVRQRQLQVKSQITANKSDARKEPQNAEELLKSMGY